MKAILLSFDEQIKYSMLCYIQYMNLWKACPFKFRVPWNTNKPTFFEDKNNVELIQCNSKIRPTMEALVADIPDDEWIYWCIDDRFPIALDHSKLNEIYTNIESYNEYDFVKPFKHEKICTLDYCPFNQAFVIQDSRHAWGFYMHHFTKARILKEAFFHDVNTIDDYHKIILNQNDKRGLIYPFKPEIVSAIDFLEPCIDGKITADGIDYLNRLGLS